MLSAVSEFTRIHFDFPARLRAADAVCAQE